jgi:hypothetical protein
MRESNSLTRETRPSYREGKVLPRETTTLSAASKPSLIAGKFLPRESKPNVRESKSWSRESNSYVRKSKGWSRESNSHVRESSSHVRASSSHVRESTGWSREANAPDFDECVFVFSAAETDAASRIRAAVVTILGYTEAFFLRVVLARSLLHRRSVSGLSAERVSPQPGSSRFPVRCMRRRPSGNSTPSITCHRWSSS